MNHLAQTAEFHADAWFAAAAPTLGLNPDPEDRDDVVAFLEVAHAMFLQLPTEDGGL